MPPTSSESWQVISTFSDAASAHVLVNLLRTEGVPAEIMGNTSLLGEARLCEIRVPLLLATTRYATAAYCEALGYL